MAVVPSLAEVFPVLLAALALVSAADTTCPSPCTCADMYGELTVSCAGQGLTEIPPNIPTDVMWLNLKYNNITRITSNSFRGLQNLRGVDLAKNNIYHISTSAFRDLQRLQTVDISVNQLSTLSEEVFNASITSARQDQRNFFVYMSDNPWNCDCGLKWLAEKLKTGSSHYSNRLISCNQPEYLTGEELENVPLDRLVCAPKLGADLNVNFMEVFNTVTPTPTSKPLLREPDKYRTDKMSFNIALGTAGAVIVIIVVGVKMHEFYKQKCSRRQQPVMEDLETLV